MIFNDVFVHVGSRKPDIQVKEPGSADPSFRTVPMLPLPHHYLFQPEETYPSYTVRWRSFSMPDAHEEWKAREREREGGTNLMRPNVEETKRAAWVCV